MVPTVDFLTNIRFTENMTSLITVNGKNRRTCSIKSDAGYITPEM